MRANLVGRATWYVNEDYAYSYHQVISLKIKGELIFKKTSRKWLPGWTAKFSGGDTFFLRHSS